MDIVCRPGVRIQKIVRASERASNRDETSVVEDRTCGRSYEPTERAGETTLFASRANGRGSRNKTDKEESGCQSTPEGCYVFRYERTSR